MCSLQLMTLAKLRGSAFNFLKLTVSYSNIYRSGNRPVFYMQFTTNDTGQAKGFNLQFSQAHCKLKLCLYCGDKAPTKFRSSSRFLYVQSTTDDTGQAKGFSIQFSQAHCKLKLCLYCGDTAPSKFRSSFRFLYVQFTTDDTGQAKGFNLQFSQAHCKL